MLIHVTRLQDVQRRVGDQITDHLQMLKDRIRYGDPSRIEEELRQLWERDFAPDQLASSPPTKPSVLLERGPEPRSARPQRRSKYG